MFSIWTLSAVTIAYLAILFVIANWANRKKHISNNVYALALGVHCTSWAFFGTATQASQFGWPVVPTYFGCMLVMLFGIRILKVTADICKRHQITSISEFISTRFFHSNTLSILVLIICVIGVVPYIALQLDAITDAVTLLSRSDSDTQSLRISFYIMLTMAAFVVIFGSRTLDLTQKHPGLMYSLAFESLVKLIALGVVGLFVVYGMYDGLFDLLGQALSTPNIAKSLNQPFEIYIFASHVLLGICAMFCLPRQFHVNFIENRNEKEIDRARWLFPLYLLGMTTFILPIAIAGDLAYGHASGMADQYVLLLPMNNNAPIISLIALLGGVAASTSMVIVATLALGNMFNTSVITPIWLKTRKDSFKKGQLSKRQLLIMRHVVIFSLVFIAYLYHIYIAQQAPLVKSGTIAIALLAQLTPAIMAAIYWHKASTLAVILGIMTGSSVVIIQMLYPAMTASYYFEIAPSDLAFANAIFLSLGLNTAMILMVSLMRPNRRIHTYARQQLHTPFLQIEKQSMLKVLASVLSSDVLKAFTEKLEADSNETRVSGLALIHAERLLSSHLGNASAKIVLNSLAENQLTNEEELTELVGQASQTFHFRHEVLQSSLAHLPQGVSVVDANLNLIAWNKAYEQLFDFPNDFLVIGMKVEDILTFNAKRGLLTPIPGERAEEAIQKRTQMMRAGQSYKFTRRFTKEQVLEISGSALPGGGYITTYTDVTEHFQTQQELRQATLELEQRVEERTHDLAIATERANQANQSKTKFLAAAGHDLMQPVNAATLLASMLSEKLKATEHYQTSENLLTALENADQQLAMLLEISKLDSDRIQPKSTVFALNDVFQSLIDELTVIARQKSITLKFVSTNVIIETDKGLLTRVLQNLISNAIRYTESGTVLIGVRHRENKKAEIWVCDTGSGIASENLDTIFEEFSRLDKNRHAQGLGLGLAIVNRTCDLLGLDIKVSSNLGTGSIFKISIPKSIKPRRPVSSKADKSTISPAQFLRYKRVLVLENDADVSSALFSLFTDWGAEVTVATQKSDIEKHAASFDIIFADYHLNAGENGIEVTQFLRQQSSNIRIALLSSADRSDDIRALAADADMAYIPKPVKSPALKRLLISLLSRK